MDGTLENRILYKTVEEAKRGRVRVRVYAEAQQGGRSYAPYTTAPRYAGTPEAPKKIPTEYQGGPGKSKKSTIPWLGPAVTDVYKGNRIPTFFARSVEWLVASQGRKVRRLSEVTCKSTSPLPEIFPPMAKARQAVWDIRAAQRRAFKRAGGRLRRQRRRR